MAESGDDQDELKKKLVRRIGIAGALIVVLLGGLTLLEDALLEKPAPVTEPPKAGTPPAEEKQAAAQPEEKKEEAGPVPSKVEEAEPEKTETPLAPAPAPIPEPRPAGRVVIKPPAAAPATPPKKPVTVRAEKAEPAPKADFASVIARSYRLQMGVFSSASNAEELHAKLEKAGIPSYIETRVQVGPFKTQKEADEARRKLKELGLGPGLLLPPQKH